MEEIWRDIEGYEGLYQVSDKKFLETVKVVDVIISLEVFIKEFGARAHAAANNEGIDWKAMSHALRAAYQAEQIYAEGTVVFPLKQAEYLKAVKLGQLDYTTEVAPILEGLMDRVDVLAADSDFPEHVDYEFWEQFVYDVIEEVYEY